MAKMAIKSALDKLDPKSDDDWTQGGLPSVERMQALTGDPDLTRAAISDAAPGYSRPEANPAPSKIDNLRKSKTEAPGPDLPADDAGRGNPNDAANNAERRIVGGEDEGKRDMPEYESAQRRVPTADEIARACPDPVLLLEAATIAASNGRYGRNSSLQALIRGYRVAQNEIKDIQGRLDKRIADREERREERKEPA